jgi:hypothetical protein
MTYLVQITEGRRRYFFKEMCDCRRVAVFYSRAAANHIIDTLPAGQSGAIIEHEAEGEIYVLPRAPINDQMPF